jgi:hypothetical protein
VEQRTEETPRQSKAAAEDTGPPGDDQPDTEQAADETAVSNGHTGGDRESIWDPPPRNGNGRPAAAYPADEAYTVDDGYGPPGTERAAANDFPSSSVASQTFGASPSESIYGSSGSQPDYSAYPSQVTTARPEDQRPATSPASSGSSGSTVASGPAAPSGPGPQSGPSAPSAAETTRVDQPAAPSGPSAWQAATSRIPKPQQVPKRTRADKKADKKASTSARQAHLMVSRFEPWSVMKFSFMISLACFVILFAAVALLYATLSGLGVFDAIQNSLSNVTSGQGTGGVNISHYLSASTILSYTALLGVLNVFLITAFCTVGSLIYNLTSHLIGGVEVTLRETE